MDPRGEIKFCTLTASHSALYWTLSSLMSSQKWLIISNTSQDCNWTSYIILCRNSDKQMFVSLGFTHFLLGNCWITISNRKHAQHTSASTFTCSCIGENPCTDVLIRLGVTMVTKLPCINIGYTSLPAYRLEDGFINISPSADGFNISLAFEFMLRSHIYSHKIP